MVAWKVQDFGGEIPRRGPRLLPDNMAVDSLNADLQRGPLQGLPQPQTIINLSAAPYPVRKAYRYPDPTGSGNPDVWLPLPSEFSSVVRSPLTNDTQHRIYWTNPQGQPAAGAWWTTYAALQAGGNGGLGTPPPYNMGYLAPASTIGITLFNVTGGTATALPETRSYCFTYINADGSESNPCVPSNSLSGPPDGSWNSFGYPIAPPANPPGLNYPPVSHMRLYRTISGTTGPANFYFVFDFNFSTGGGGAGPGVVHDTTPTSTVVNNNTLITTSFNPPLTNLDGLTAMPGGMLVGFTDNTIHFCEPNLPHAWPASYDLGVLYQIVGLAVWQQSLVILTQGYPSTGVGNTPGQFTIAQVQAPEPCIARGSIVTDLAGVYYASQNGLIMLNYFGMQNQTLANMTRNIWLTEYQAQHIIACRHRAQYLAINGTGMGFLIDYAEAREGVCHVSPFVNVVSVWNDVYTGDAYMCDTGGTIYLWDSTTTPPLNYYWCSKEFTLPIPVAIGAIQVFSDPSISDPAPPPVVPPPLGGTVALPPGINAVFNLYRGPGKEVLVHTQNLTQQDQIFRAPGGFKAFIWQFDITANVPVHSVELATTMKELRKI